MTSGRTKIRFNISKTSTSRSGGWSVHQLCTRSDRHISALTELYNHRKLVTGLFNSVVCRGRNQRLHPCATVDLYTGRKPTAIRSPSSAASRRPLTSASTTIKVTLLLWFSHFPARPAPVELKNRYSLFGIYLISPSSFVTSMLQHQKCLIYIF